MLRAYENGALFLLFVMLMVWAEILRRIYVGRAIGKHKLAPRVSPGKSWEGTIASLVGAVVVAMLLFHYLRPICNGLHAVRHLAQPAGYHSSRW